MQRFGRVQINGPMGMASFDENQGMIGDFYIQLRWRKTPMASSSTSALIDFLRFGIRIQPSLRRGHVGAVIRSIRVAAPRSADHPGKVAPFRRWADKDMTYLIVQTLNGLSFGMLLFLLSAGLSLNYGLMRVLNLTHGSFYLIGGYIGLTTIQQTGSFILAVAVASLAVGNKSGIVMELFCCVTFITKKCQTLLTFGCLFIFADLALVIWGGEPRTLPRPDFLSGSVSLGGVYYPLYRLFIIAAGAVVAVLLWWLIEGTRIGAMLRAGVDNEEVARGTGINVSILFTSVFALGAFLAALGGVIGGPLLGVFPGADYHVMLLAFVVIIIGGLGSVKGALVGSIVVGLLDNFGKVYFPEFALFTIFAPMAIILSVRPQGLFGRA